MYTNGETINEVRFLEVVPKTLRAISENLNCASEYSAKMLAKIATELEASNHPYPDLCRVCKNSGNPVICSCCVPSEHTRARCFEIAED